VGNGRRRGVREGRAAETDIKGNQVLVEVLYNRVLLGID
jgi:hypothetical protein